MMVAPRILWYSRMLREMAWAPTGSRPAVGSSRMSTLGSMAITPAMATRRFWPPESSKGDLSSWSSRRPTK